MHEGGAGRIDPGGRSSELLGTDSASRVRALTHVSLQLFDHGLGLIRKGGPKTPQDLAVRTLLCGGSCSGFCLHPELPECRQIQLIADLMHHAARSIVQERVQRVQACAGF